MYLLDTNIIIYFLLNKKLVRNFFEKNKIQNSAISMISRLEVLLGAEKESRPFHELEAYLDKFTNIPLDADICREAALLKLKEKKTLKFKDLVIAATARQNNLTLVTADKDFKTVKGINLQLINL